MPPCVIFEDEHLLVVNKPAGINTHAPGPFAGEGIYEWLRHREPRWSRLAIIHRLDKETSGVLVFGKTPEANKSLTAQFETREVHKKYLLLTNNPVPSGEVTVVSSLVRNGEKYLSRPLHTGAARAETRFRNLGIESGHTLLEAEPVTGRTHQIRVHAAARGFPVLGDALYGGTPAPRVCLHALELKLRHPINGADLQFTAPVNFAADARMALRDAFVGSKETDACRLVHGAADGWPGWYVEQLGDFLLSHFERPLDSTQNAELKRLLEIRKARGAYHKTLMRQVRGAAPKDSSPQHVLGEAAPDNFAIRENGLQFEMSFREGYSVGLFLDQRDNRRRLLVNHIAAEFPAFPGGTAAAEILNLFAYTCGFSLCAAKSGARATSVDLSKKHLAWGRRNFELNRLNPGEHEFIYGDAFDWLRRLAKKERKFDLILLDPPTFSQSRGHGAFRAGQDYRKLADAALLMLKPGGVLFAATNAARLKPEEFLESLKAAVKSARRRILQEHYVPQPPDFPVHRDEPAYLKTVWFRVG
jgi:23S rRNA (cytosine1962-C5)-methyltransferase